MSARRAQDWSEHERREELTDISFPFPSFPCLASSTTASTQMRRRLSPYKASTSSSPCGHEKDGNLTKISVSAHSFSTAVSFAR